MDASAKQTPEAGSPPPPLDDSVRRAWFATFGYTGDLDEVVSLRAVDGVQLGTATVADVWAVRKGLRELQDYPGLFRRVLLGTLDGERVIDPAHHLSRTEHGPLTDGETGQFLPGRAAIIKALFDIDADAVTGTEAVAPLVPREGSKAA